MKMTFQNERQYLLPIYLLGADINYIQEPIDRPNGYPSYQLSICLDGEGVFVDENNIEHKIKKGCIFFFSPNIPHKYTPVSKEWKCPYIVFTGHCAENIVNFLGLRSTFVAAPEGGAFNNIIFYFNKIYETYLSALPTKSERCSGMLYSLLIYISEILRSEEQNEVNRCSQQLAPVMSHIRTNMHRDISVEELAGVIGVSVGRLTVLFKQAFGTTPAQTVRKLKIESAKHKLEAFPNIKIKELAEMLGFNTTAHFVTTFKNEVGMSPSEYKKNLKSPLLW